MMEKISIQEIATILIEKNGLKRKEADLFVTTMFELIKETLPVERIVKIKGLGTFKVIDIEARESVNVNTGQRVLIEGHDKITFTPDATMKELVNKPFSQFETVVLNEGVTFEDMPEEPEETPPSPFPVALAATVAEFEPEPEPASEPVSEPEPEPEAVPEPKLKPVAVSEPELEPKPVSESETEPEPEPETEPEAVSESESEPDSEPETELQPVVDETVKQSEEKKISELETVIEEQEEEYMSKKMTYISLVVAILACVLSFAGGYYYRDNIVKTVENEEVIAEPVKKAVPADSLVADSAKADTIDLTEQNKEVKPEVKQEPQSETKTEPKSEVKSEQKTAQKEEAKPTVVSDKYEQMDVRVRTGAYRIVGTDHQVKVKAGDTFAKIARRTLGPDMECYIQVFNGLRSTDELKEGQTLQIPKLELKKKKKANN